METKMESFAWIVKTYNPDDPLEGRHGPMIYTSITDREFHPTRLFVWTDEDAEIYLEEFRVGNKELLLFPTPAFLLEPKGKDQDPNEFLKNYVVDNEHNVRLMKRGTAFTGVRSIQTAEYFVPGNSIWLKFNGAVEAIIIEGLVPVHQGEITVGTIVD